MSVGGSVPFMVRNLRCTVTFDSVLANSKTQNAFLFTVHAIFRHDYSLAVKPASTPRPLVQKRLWEILYLLICSFLSCLSWLLRSRVRKFRRDLWITLYISTHSIRRYLLEMCHLLLSTTDISPHKQLTVCTECEAWSERKEMTQRTKNFLLHLKGTELYSYRR